MKKYLMTGMAALAFCAAFTSCSKGEDLYDENAIIENGVEKIKADYASAFIATFGQPASNQDWGFGSSYAGTREENANANEWADPAKAYGGLLVPPAITPTQAAVVKTYFQTHPDLGYKDPEWSNYFIQQVYKGHTSVPQGCATPEEYTALNGTTKLIASDYMDHLAAIDGNFFDHINNFNHGDCGENDHVLDNGGNANDGPWHTDKIMYMKNSTTKSFGYFNSNGSICHTKYTALVGWKTIHDWAVNNYPNYDGCLNDTWNRSYMGFDFEQMIEGQCYANNNEVWDYSTNPATFKSGTPKTLIIYGEYYINGVKQTNYEYQYNGEPVKMLSDQTNRYCGTKIEVTDAQLYSEERDANNNNAYLGKKLNTDFIDGLLADGYLPIDNKSLREWAIVGGCADGYYSDWIVTLTEAKTDKPQGLRIIAEDLNAKAQEGDIEDSDWDFNDVVFDVTFPADDKAEITLVAAGGILPLIVGVINPTDGQAYPNNEVHALFGVDVDYMVNTNAQKKNLKGGAPVNAAPKIQFTLAGVKAANGKTIPIHVEKIINGQKKWVELEAPEGKPAAKIGVKPKFNYCDERQNITKKYPLFYEWVTNPYVEWYKLN